MEETPTISNARLLLLGVKETLNKLAVKLELPWHVLRDFDSINRRADGPERRERRDIKTVKGGSNVEDRTIACLC
jgi:hypothetical protein